VALLGMAGCVSTPVHDAMLEDARTYVHDVRSDPQVQTYAAVEIEQAVVTLRRADDVLARGGTRAEAHELAQLARERATLAQHTARMKSAEAAAQAERQRLEVAARAREAEAAQRAARDAQLQAEAARQQAAAAQRQAESAQQHAAAVERQAMNAEASLRAMQGQLNDLGPHLTSRGIVITLNDILFDRGGAQLQPAGRQAVHRLADYLVRNPGMTVAVEGFTDSAGDRYWNEQLSERRALAVHSELAALGVDPRRIIVRGYGPAYPIASNETLSGRQTNRRVEIVISDRGYVPRA
jgi:outer membrane protein OmpA-like peptidoglycan-associated protein